MHRPRRVLMTVLIANTTVNIAIFAVSYVLLESLGKSSPAVSAAGGVLSLAVVIVFGEIVPKALALSNARRFAPMVAPVIEALALVTTPLRWVLRYSLVEPLTRLLSSPRPRRPAVSSEDLRALVELSAEQSIISSREHDMLQVVLVLPEIPVRAVMVPRVNIKAASVDAERADLIEMFRTARFKKLPLIGRDLDDIRGVLYARDLYLQPDKAASELMRPARYVPEVINLVQLIDYFQTTRSQFAIVVDEHGGVSGLVALEDVLEEVVGELEAADRPVPDTTVERIDERTYRLSGAMSVRDWRDSLGIGGRFKEMDTIGGVVLARLGRLPHEGDQVRFGNLTITVDRVAARRIDRVLVHVDPAAESDGTGEAG